VLFTACALKNTNYNSQSLLVTINSSSLKINDLGFLKSSKHTLNLEIYKLGKPFFTIKINDKICLNKICYEKKIFNQKFFQNAYYEDFLEDILNAKALWNAQNLQKTSCGFYQNLNTKNYEIFYEVCEGEIKFNDKISKIKISLRKI